jgi:hypothetical protein
VNNTGAKKGSIIQQTAFFEEKKMENVQHV